MKKGYDVILSLRYTTNLKIETDKEDEEEIKEDARQCFIQDVLDVTGARDLLEDTKAVKIERNYSEQHKVKTTPQRKLKEYIVWFFSRSSEIYVTVPAVNETEAEEKAEDEITLKLTSDDGKTECTINRWFLEDVKLAD